MKILITGGCGFAGKYLSSFLAERGHDITATYRDSLKNECNGIKYVKQELSEPIDIDGNFDAIIHTAVSKSGAELSINEYIRDNIESAKSIVEYAQKKGIRTIVYFSTRTIYGEIRKKEIYEEDDITNPSKYGATKRIAEQIFQEAEGINSIGLRVPNIIGPGAHDIWLTDITSKIRNNENVEVSDFYTKNLVSIKDVGLFIEELLKNSIGGKSFKYSVVNLACSEMINNITIAEHIKEKLGSTSKITIVEPAKGLFWLNSEKAKEMGFKSSLPMEIVDYYIDNLIGIK